MKMLFATFAACVSLGLSIISVSVACIETPGEVNFDPILLEYQQKGVVDTYRFSPTSWKNVDGESFRMYWDGNTHGSLLDHSYKRHGCSASNDKLLKELNQVYYL